jgi:hypothetical protein
MAVIRIMTYADDPRHDVLRRDFTIRVAHDPLRRLVLDFVEGQRYPGPNHSDYWQRRTTLSGR